MRRMSPSLQARRSSEIVARGILVHLRGRAVPRVNHVPGALAMVPLHLLAAALLFLLHDRSSWLCCRCGVTERLSEGSSEDSDPVRAQLLEVGGDSWHSHFGSATRRMRNAAN